MLIRVAPALWLVDNIERLIEWVPIGTRFSNALLQTLMMHMRKTLANSHQLLILATTTECRLLRDLDLYGSFNDVEVPTVNSYNELRYILEKSETFVPEEIEAVLGGIYSIDDDKKIGVGIKKI